MVRGPTGSCDRKATTRQIIHHRNQFMQKSSCGCCEADGLQQQKSTHLSAKNRNWGGNLHTRQNWTILSKLEKRCLVRWASILAATFWLQNLAPFFGPILPCTIGSCCCCWWFNGVWDVSLPTLFTFHSLPEYRFWPCPPLHDHSVQYNVYRLVMAASNRNTRHVTTFKSSPAVFLHMMMSSMSSNGLYSHKLSI